MRLTPQQTDVVVEELVHRHQGAVRGFLSYMGCAVDRVDDLVQDVFLSFLSARFEDRGEAATRAFLRRIARNLFLKMREREQRHPIVLDPDAAERAWVEFERDDGGIGYRDALRRCLGEVSERASEVLRLRYEERVRLTQIAGTLGMTESGVKSVLVRTKRKLKACIERRLVS